MYDVSRNIALCIVCKDGVAKSSSRKADHSEAREEGVQGAAQEVVAVLGLPALGALLGLQLQTADSRIQNNVSPREITLHVRRVACNCD